MIDNQFLDPLFKSLYLPYLSFYQGREASKVAIGEATGGIGPGAQRGRCQVRVTFNNASAFEMPVTLLISVLVSPLLHLGCLYYLSLF